MVTLYFKNLGLTIWSEGELRDSQKENEHVHCSV